MGSTAGDLRDELFALTSAFRQALQRQRRAGVWAAPGASIPRAEPEAPVVPAADPALAPTTLPTFDAEPVAASRTLAAIREELGDCQRCKLCKTRKNIVFGNGPESTPLMFIGEAPGADEDRLGDPFVGKAGELLDKMIEAMGWGRTDVYVANTLKCLRYTALVQLGDGSWERIGRLVRNRYAGTVMSVDDAGHLVPKRVIGWHASPLAGRSVYRMTYASAKAAGTARDGIQLTGDHEVLTADGYVPVERLPRDARIATGQGLSDVARDVVWGTLLGDGHINKKRAALSFSHSENQADYAAFKTELMSELRFATKAYRIAAGGEQQYPIVVASSHAHRALHAIRSDFYVPKKRVPPSLATMLNARMVAIWFMDDGHLRIRPPRRPSSEIATCAFSLQDLEVLVAGLGRLGVRGHVVRGRIHFDVEQTRRLSELIAPYVPPCMRRKLVPDIALRIPYEPSRWTPQGIEVTYEPVVVERIEHTGTDRTFFCIDVEDTHNFVTAGGVVHNCRPPNNRNPEPDETAACRPFLDAQIQAVRPRIIVTLGRPAANLVLGRDAPISSLRGRFHEHRGIRVMPTFHPAYLLREPDRKRDTWSDLKQVIAELERLGIKSPRPPRS
jgi:uracil-DNA glycosylase